MHTTDIALRSDQYNTPGEEYDALLVKELIPMIKQADVADALRWIG